MLHREHTPECMFVCRCARVVRRCLYSRCSRPRVLLSDRIGVDQCSLTEQLTWGKTPLSARCPFLFLPFSSFVLSRLLSLTLLSLTQTEIPPSYCTQLSLSPFFLGFSFSNPICLFLYHALCKDTLWEGSMQQTQPHTLTVHTDMYTSEHSHTNTCLDTCSICITCNTTLHHTFHLDWWQ